MDQAFLRKVQDEGWLIRGVDQQHAYVECPVQGCNISLKLSPVAPVPQACGMPASAKEIRLTSFEVIRQALRRRRRDLGLVIEEVESGAGLSFSHISKMEKQNPSKIPNVETLIYWAEALGMELFMRPKSIPATTLRVISETRKMTIQKRRDVAAQWSKPRPKPGPEQKLLPPPQSSK